MTSKWQAGHTYAPGALVIPTTTLPTTPPPITNGDFETGDLTGWTSSVVGIWTVDATEGYTGTHCLKYTGDGHNALNSTTHIPVTPGTPVNAIGMIRPTHSHDSRNSGQLTLTWLDNAGNSLGYTPGNSYGAKDEQGGIWSMLAVDGTAPANATHVFVSILADRDPAGAGYAQFDRIAVTLRERTAPKGLVYKATQAKSGKSGANEPAWPGMVNVPVTDNEVTWEGVIATSITWQASPIMESGDTEPAWPTAIGGVVRDGSVNWTATSRRITDKNCPNSKVVAIMASKVFAADGDIVRFCATVNPLDWTSGQNAGYLPTGLQQANGNDMAVLAPYRSNLTTFNASSFQNWQVDPDPSAMAILDQLDGVGSTHQHAAQPVGNELFYLSQLGVRTVSIAGGSDNLEAGDVGMPIDELIQSAAASDKSALGPRSAYYPSAGQFWLAFVGKPATFQPDPIPLTTFEIDNGPFVPGSDTNVWGRSADAPITGSYSLRPNTAGGAGPQASMQFVVPAAIAGTTRRLAFDWVSTKNTLSMAVGASAFFSQFTAGSGHYDAPFSALETTVTLTMASPAAGPVSPTDGAIDNLRVYYDPPILLTPAGDPIIYVCTMNAGKPKWSRYLFPWAVDAFAQLGNDLYIRHGDTISMLDEDATDDDGTVFTGIVQWPWLDMGQAGVTKMMEGFDLVASGTPSVSVGYDQTDLAMFTAPYACGPDTLTGSKIPLPLMAPTFSPKLTFAGGKKWSVQALTLYINNMRGQP